MRLGGLVSMLLVVPACGGDGRHNNDPDTGVDASAGHDAAAGDAATDAEPAAVDAGTDASLDASLDAATEVDAEVPLPEHPDWVSTDYPCLSADACPRINCQCRGGASLWVAGCLDGSCLYGGEWCAFYCGEPSSGSTNLTIACADLETRPDCITCRDAAARTCNADACEPEADALVFCLAAVARDLGDPRVTSIAWTFTNTEECPDQAEAYRDCVDDCDLGALCDPDDPFAHYPPPDLR